MSDWTDEEFKSVSHGVRPSYSQPKGLPIPDWIRNAPINELPSHIDYRERGVVTAVKNQGHCGSCWAFATTELIESHLALAQGKLVNLSPQQLVSCVQNVDQCGGQGGCSGATAELGLEYVSKHGLAEEYTWGYAPDTWLGKANGTCVDGQVPAAVSIGGFFSVDTNDADLIAKVLALGGPQAISVDASGWRDYESGVFDGCDFDKNIDINHAVQLVGYTPDAWIVRNSWSTKFGEDGYIRLKRFTPGKTPCGKDTTPENGDGCPGGPSEIQVCGMCGMAYDSVVPDNTELV